jgi:hypothetical protein
MTPIPIPDLAIPARIPIQTRIQRGTENKKGIAYNERYIVIKTKVFI